MPGRAAPRPFISLIGVCWRWWPVLAAGLALEPILLLGREPARWLFKASGLGSEQAWAFVALACVFQGLVGIAGILAMRRLLPQADGHLRWPAPGRSMAGTALLVGLGMALVMFVADYAPQLVTGTPPTAYSTAPADAAGWIVGIALGGFAEEPIFRGLFVGALAVLVPGRVRIGRVDLPLAAYIVALLFAAAHWRSFTVTPFHMALAQQLYAVAWGLTYVWLMERSRSLLAPIIAHASGNALEVSLVVLWRSLTDA